MIRDTLAFAWLVAVWAVVYCIVCPPARAAFAVPAPVVTDMIQVIGALGIAAAPALVIVIARSKS